MAPNDPRELVAEFLRRQATIYQGGDPADAAELLADDIVWHVPGRSPIASDNRGRAAVLAYFAHRRALAANSMRMEVIATASHDEAVVHLTDGVARLGNEEVSWRTAGIYRITNGRIAEVWLVPLDLTLFDELWSRPRRWSHRHAARVRPQECNDGAVLGHPRFLEHCEAAFVEAWRERWGSLDETLGPARRMTVGAVDVHFHAPARVDEMLTIDVSFDRIGTTSLLVAYAATVERREIADGRVRYVCLDTATGAPAELPAGVREVAASS